MTCVVTGVLWLMKPQSLLDVILYDYLHVSLYVVALYFALRGNVKYDLLPEKMVDFDRKK